MAWPRGSALSTSRSAPLDQSTVGLRLAALGSFYEFHRATARAPRIENPGRVSTGRFKPFLAHLQDRRPTRRAALVRQRRTRMGLTPVLDPTRIDAIFEACAVWSAGQRRWVANLRNRLFYETLAETGPRLGDELSLRHEDWIVGRGRDTMPDGGARQAHPHGARVKNSKWRRIYVSDRLERLYSDYLDIDTKPTQPYPPVISQHVITFTAGAHDVGGEQPTVQLDAGTTVPKVSTW